MASTKKLGRILSSAVLFARGATKIRTKIFKNGDIKIVLLETAILPITDKIICKRTEFDVIMKNQKTHKSPKIYDNRLLDLKLKSASPFTTFGGSVKCGRFSAWEDRSFTAWGVGFLEHL